MPSYSQTAWNKTSASHSAPNCARSPHPLAQQDFAASTTAAQSNTNKQNSWLVSPSVDLLFVCGIAPWLFGIIAALVTNQLDVPSQHPFNLLFVLASLLIGEGHQFTSIIRYVAKRAEDFKQGKGRKKTWLLLAAFFHLVIVPVTVVRFNLAADPTGITSIYFGIVAGTMATIGFVGMVLFPLFLMHHICAQAQAVGLIYCGKQGFQLSPPEKLILSMASWTLVLAGIFNIAVPFGFSQLLAKSTATTAISTILNEVAAVVSLTFVLAMLKRGRETGSWLPKRAALLWTNLVFFILLSWLPSMLYVWLFVPLFFHATQHWAIAWDTQGKERDAESIQGKGFRKLLTEFCKLTVPVLAVTVGVMFLPMLISGNNPLQVGSSKTLDAGFTMLVFYIHYIADRTVWRNKKDKGESNGNIAV